MSNLLAEDGYSPPADIFNGNGDENANTAKDGGRKRIAIPKRNTKRGAQSKKESHNLAEQKRRDKINDIINEIKELLPDTGSVSNKSRMHKAAVLSSALNYIRNLKAAVYELQVEVTNLRLENMKYMREVGKLPESNTSEPLFPAYPKTEQVVAPVRSHKGFPFQGGREGAKREAGDSTESIQEMLRDIKMDSTAGWISTNNQSMPSFEAAPEAGLFNPQYEYEQRESINLNQFFSSEFLQSDYPSSGGSNLSPPQSPLTNTEDTGIISNPSSDEFHSDSSEANDYYLEELETDQGRTAADVIVDRQSPGALYLQNENGARKKRKLFSNFIMDSSRFLLLSFIFVSFFFEHTDKYRDSAKIATRVLTGYEMPSIETGYMGLWHWFHTFITYAGLLFQKLLLLFIFSLISFCVIVAREGRVSKTSVDFKLANKERRLGQNDFAHGRLQKAEMHFDNALELLNRKTSSFYVVRLMQFVYHFMRQILHRMYIGKAIDRYIVNFFNMRDTYLEAAASYHGLFRISLKQQKHKYHYPIHILDALCALNLAESVGDTPELTEIYTSLSQYLQVTNSFLTAFTETFLGLAWKSAGIATVDKSIGWLFYITGARTLANGEWKPALNALKRSTKIFQETKKDYRALQSVKNIALIMFFTGRLDKAIELFRYTLDNASKCQSEKKVRQLRLRSHLWLASCYGRLNDVDNMKLMLNEAEALVKGTQDENRASGVVYRSLLSQHALLNGDYVSAFNVVSVDLESMFEKFKRCQHMGVAFWMLGLVTSIDTSAVVLEDLVKNAGESRIRKSKELNMPVEMAKEELMKFHERFDSFFSSLHKKFPISRPYFLYYSGLHEYFSQNNLDKALSKMQQCYQRADHLEMDEVKMKARRIVEGLKYEKSLLERIHEI